MIRARPLRPRIGQSLSSQAQRGQDPSEPVRYGGLPGQGQATSVQVRAMQDKNELPMADPGRAGVSLDQVLAVRSEPSGLAGPGTAEPAVRAGPASARLYQGPRAQLSQTELALTLLRSK